MADSDSRVSTVVTRLQTTGCANDYNQLNNLSSVVLYNTKPPRRRTYRNAFNVERIISRKNVEKNKEYLIKWQDWPLESCTWEPSEHLSPELIRIYDTPPRPSNDRLQLAGSNFYSAILTQLKGNSFATFYASIELDIWRYISHNKGRECEHRGHKLYELNDLNLFSSLPNHWWYCLDNDGQGRAINFPIKVKAVLSWTPKHFISKNNKLVPAPRLPLEKLAISIVKRACNMETL